MDEMFRSDAQRARRQFAGLLQRPADDRLPDVSDDTPVEQSIVNEPVNTIHRDEIVEEYRALMDSVHAMRASHAAVAAIPPAPPTLRARVGSWFVRAVRRALFWYTEQILLFHRDATAATEQLAREIVSLRRGLDGLQAQISAEVALRSRETAALTREIGVRNQEILTRIETIAAGMQALDAVAETGDLNASDIILLRDRLWEHRTRLDHESATREHLQIDVNDLRQQLRTAVRALADAERMLLSTREGLLSQEMRVSVLLECARKRLPEMDAGQVRKLVSEDAHKIDSFYTTFEDLFRGTRTEVRERLQEYLPILKSHGIGGPDMPVVDIGCGRGEWLELLVEQGMDCRGVDSNRAMLARCLERNLPATEGDALSYLTALPEQSVGAVTGLHIIEHLPFGTLVDLFDQTVRVLKPGGVAIFETPNPANVLVSASQFYLDPTHRNPLPSPLVRFLAEQRGLCRVEILNLHPCPAGVRIPENGSAVAERFNQLFYGPQDYAVVGWKV